MTRFYNRRLRALILLALAVLLAAVPLSLSGCQELFEVSTESTELNLVFPRNSSYGDALTVYQSLYPKVKVNITYLDNINYQKSIQQLKTEIMTGKGPDIIFDTLLGSADMYKVMKAGAFTDLTEYIQNDSEFHMEDYWESVMQAGCFQGKQLLLPIKYRPLFLTTTQELLDKSEFDMDSASKDWFTMMETFIAYCESTEDKIPLFLKGVTLRGELKSSAGIPFINYDTDSLEWDRASQVKEALRLYKTYSSVIGNAASVFYSYEAHPLLQDDAIFLDITSELNNNMNFLLNGKVHPVFLPLRNVDGKKVASVDEMIGINSASPNKQNAWNYIKILLSFDMQSRTKPVGDSYYPVHKSAFEERLAALDSSAGENQELKSVLAELKAVIAAPEAVYSYGFTGYEEIFPYMQDYFEGRAGLDETFDAALKKMERYLSE